MKFLLFVAAAFSSNSM